MQVLFRADASTQIGTGHVMRCLALAQACLAEGGQAHFLMGCEGATLAQRLTGEGVAVSYGSVPWASEADAQNTIALAKDLQADWVIVDGYHFGAEYQKWLKDVGTKLLVLDDYGHATHYWADIVLNQNITAEEEIYANRESYTKLLLGTRYALLREEFWPWRSWKRQITPIASKVLVTLGGSDPSNITLAVIQALQKAEIAELEAVVVAGASNPHCSELAQAVKGWEKSITLKQNVTNMPELMAWADLAITAGGSTCWETAFMGLPSMAIPLVENQTAIVKTLSSLDAVVSISSHEAFEINSFAHCLEKYLKQQELRSSLSKKFSNLVDGYGSERLAMVLQESLIRLRPVNEEDCSLLWHWANDPVTRASSFSSELISWHEHIQWFNAKIKSESCTMYIALNNRDQPVGLIRCEVDAKNEAVVSINIASQYRGMGYASSIIEKSSSKMLRNSKLHQLNAYVKQDNLASIKAFLKAGFKQTDKPSSETSNSKPSAIHLIKQNHYF
ncbi:MULTISPECIES: UDP-2,4-diacetamido-2,4,6-trideoxy-beta-L-altropyranose hydrolase [Cyanophyceae]|uniref:UDP-2,4-diacetamido-2,4, 6-trideoxy-beta-L-altropyranose hydrolase n=1 Tax=Leptolyngbya subtilissima DQ-A4 TaxID=2933933 RepID=A0ABV0K6K0_9CYAN|nr:UDP-2,4-diacetamido-2,4,6-trideoxy-beta-L-altropyranose hydrolase [Nodosilinea sp. FACHB-141]MBD2113948.1 UDP-2,4-diacetamido-2,4,6-trideoxy-beta-L-altropyranose hydrolase [Nodosilinea sp. FACHB-141]